MIWVGKVYPQALSVTIEHSPCVIAKAIEIDMEKLDPPVEYIEFPIQRHGITLAEKFLDNQPRWDISICPFTATPIEVEIQPFGENGASRSEIPARFVRNQHRHHRGVAWFYDEPVRQAVDIDLIRRSIDAVKLGQILTSDPFSDI